MLQQLLLFLRPKAVNLSLSFSSIGIQKRISRFKQPQAEIDLAKILVIEDDQLLGTEIVAALADQGYLVDLAQSGADARCYFGAAQYDLIVLDWELPDVTGPVLCQELIFAQPLSVPVIFVTARSSIQDKERGFAVGADDYLTKPFHMTELLARVKALLRRPASKPSKDLKIRDLVLDRERHEILRDGSKISLFPQEYALLEFFMTHPNHIFSAEDLLQRIWSTDSESSVETVRVTLMRIRQKIDKPGEKPLIMTLRKIGYRLEP